MQQSRNKKLSLPSLGEVLALLDATSQERSINRDLAALRLQDAQATQQYATSQGYPSLQALQLAQTDQDRDARMDRRPWPRPSSTRGDVWPAPVRSAS